MLREDNEVVLASVVADSEGALLASIDQIYRGRRDAHY